MENTQIKLTFTKNPFPCDFKTDGHKPILRSGIFDITVFVFVKWSILLKVFAFQL